MRTYLAIMCIVLGSLLLLGNVVSGIRNSLNDHSGDGVQEDGTVITWALGYHRYSFCDLVYDNSFLSEHADDRHWECGTSMMDRQLGQYGKQRTLIEHPSNFTDKLALYVNVWELLAVSLLFIFLGLGIIPVKKPEVVT